MSFRFLNKLPAPPLNDENENSPPAALELIESCGTCWGIGGWAFRVAVAGEQFGRGGGAFRIAANKKKIRFSF